MGCAKHTSFFTSPNQKHCISGINPIAYIVDGNAGEAELVERPLSTTGAAEEIADLKGSDVGFTIDFFCKISFTNKT